MPEISIIVPVYNREKLLEKSLESLLRQEFKDIEIICIDDGSTDGSLEKLQAYASKDKRVKVYHKENGGVSSARNLGLKVATGKYIMFCDSDDEYFPETCKEVHKKIEKYSPDIVMFDYVDNNDKNNILFSQIIRKKGECFKKTSDDW